MADAAANPADYNLPDPHPVRRLGRLGLVAGVLGAAALAYGAMETPEQFYRSYLVSYLYFVGITLGSLLLLLIVHVAAGPWGAVIRRTLEAATRTLPLMAILFVPVVLGIHDLYEWSHQHVVEHDKVLQHKAIYLNEDGFIIRSVIYFVIWIGIMFFLNRWSRQEDEQGRSATLAKRFMSLGCGGILLYALTITFASVDWAMSLEPHWFSTIYGVIFAGGQILCAMAFTIFITSRLAVDGPFADKATPKQFHDMGKMMLAFTMLWAYFSFSQFLIIWAGNLPEEIPWYLNRFEGGWELFAVLILLFHFALPFTSLLSRNLKRSARTLSIVATLMLIMRFVDMFWQITPAWSPKDTAFHWLDAAAFIGLGGIWLAFFVRQLQKRPLVPIHDPELPS